MAALPLFSGGRRFTCVRHWRLWKHYRDYFPLKVSSPRSPLRPGLSPDFSARSWVRLGVEGAIHIEALENDAPWSCTLGNLHG